MTRLSIVLLVTCLGSVAVTTPLLAAERWTIGLTANDAPIEALVIPGASVSAPTVLLVGGLHGPDDSVDAVRREADAFETLPQSRRAYRLIAVPGSNPEAHGLQFPPTGTAYRDNAVSHVLWRWIGLHAPDMVIIAGRDDASLAAALSQHPVALVGTIPSRTVPLGSALLAGLPASIPRSDAHGELDRRRARTPQALARELAQVYGRDFAQPTYMSLLNTLFIRSALRRMVLPHSRSAQRRPRMKLHRNAKSTPTSRALLVRRVLVEGWSYAQAAEGLGVSIRTVAKWVRRFKEGGVAALEDASSRPGAPPHQTPPGAVALIRVLREQHALPAWAIGRALDIPRSTVSAWLRRLGLHRPPTAPPIPVQRYEWPRPGDLLHVDIKPLGRIGQIGHRIHGDRRRATRGIGWEYVHVAIDDHSRLAYVEVLGDQLGTTCAAFLQRAVAWYQAHGITTCRVMSDNGSGYVSRAWRATCEALGVRHLRTRAYTPRTNGKAERFIQTLLREWAYVAPYASSQIRRATLRPYVQYYNRQRPHASLDYQAPWSRLTSAA